MSSGACIPSMILMTILGFSLFWGAWTDGVASAEDKNKVFEKN